MNSSRWLAALLVFLGISAGIGLAEPAKDSFAGKFKDDRLGVEIVAEGDHFTGTIRMGEHQYPLTAHLENGKLLGTFTSDGHSFSFTASHEGNHLTFVTEGTTYNLQNAVTNPLAAPANPLVGNGASPPAAQADPGTFSELASTDSGKTLFIKKPDAKNVQTAIIQTANDLARIFDGKPALAGGFADAKSQTKGGASFTAKLKGKDIRGLILCGSDGQGAAVSVMYSTVDAPAADVATLTAALPAQATMQPYHFPDGSGTIDIPKGWTTQSQNILEGVYARGPGHQAVGAGIRYIMNPPDCNILQTYRQNVINGRRLGWDISKMPDPSKDMFICPLVQTPEDIIKVAIPVIWAKNGKITGITIKLDRVIQTIGAQPNPMIQNDKAAIFIFTTTDTKGDERLHMRAMYMVDWFPVQDGKNMWGLGFDEVYAAPDETFDHDFPLMRDILASRNPDLEWCKQHWKNVAVEMEENRKAFIRQQQDSFARSQKYIADQNDRFQRMQSIERNREQARHNSNSDFIEMIRGYRDVYDTSTGRTTTVDYYNSHAIVDGMNAAVNDPHHYIEIPLRYER